MQDLKVVLRIDGKTGKVRLEVEKLEESLKGVGESGKKAGDKVSSGMKKAETGTSAAREAARGMRDELVRLASVGFAIKLAKDTIRIADEMKLLDARINLVTDSQASFNTASEETTRIALETHTAIGTTVDLYTRLERALAGQKVAQKSVLQITETINQAMGVSGATAAETSSVITQLSQGLAAGALRGEEFNSVNESGSRIMQALKDDLGKTSGQLREMAFNGELTTEILTTALLNQSAKISAEFGQLPLTVEKALGDLRTNFALYAKDIDGSIDVTGKLAGSIKFLGDNLEGILDTTGKAITVFALYKGIGGVLGVAASLKQAAAATVVYDLATRKAIVSTTSMGIASKALRGSMALLGGPAGLIALAAFGLYELSGSMELSSERIEELTHTSDEAGEALRNAFGSAIDNKPLEAILELDSAIEHQITRIRELRAELNNIKPSENIFGVQRGTLSGTELQEQQLANESLRAAELAKKGIEDIRNYIDANGSAISTAVGSISGAYKELGASLEQYGVILPGIITNEQLLAQQTQENTKNINDWLESSEKQLAKITAKNAAFGKSTIQIIKDEAATKKSLTTDKLLRAEIDKRTKSLIKETKQYETKVELKKQQEDLAREEIRLIQEYGTEAEKIALINQAEADYLKQFPSLKQLANKEYDKQREAVKALNPELEKQNKLWDDYQDLLNDLGVIDEVEASFLALEVRIEDMAASGKFSIDVINEMRDALNGMKLKAEEAGEALNSIRGVNYDKDGNSTGFNNEANFNDLLSQGQTLGNILSDAGKGFENGLQSSANSMNVLLQGAQALNDIWESTAGKDDAGRALDSIAQIAATGALGPIAQAVAQVAQTIDALTGGRLFGTSYEAESAAANFSLSNGGSGSTSTTEVRNRSLFRGRQWRTTVDALTGEALDAIQQIFQQTETLAHQTAQAIGGVAAEIVTASFNQEFDADGNVTSSKSTVNGRTYNDSSLQEFANRVYGEQIIAGLADSLPQVEQQVTTFFGSVEEDFNEGFNRLTGSFSQTSTRLVSEIEVLAEPFRASADDLLEFAKFALLAVADIKNGSELLGSLTETLGLVQELQNPSESLSDTYSRLAQATIVVEDAMSIMGITSDQTREQLIRTSAAMAEFAGGVQELAGLWNTYFEEFYTPEELLQQSIGSQSDLLGQQATNLGIDPSITEAQFRSLFETQVSLGNLTEEQVVQWLEFGGTLSRVNNLLDEQNEIEQERINLLAEYNNFGDSIRRQISDINGVDSSLVDLHASYQANINTYHELARAAGLAGASEQDLADAHELYVAQIRQATNALFDQLYGDDLDARIADLEATQTSGISNVSNASSNLFSAWKSAIDNLRDYTRSRLVDEFSPLDASQRLAQAESDFFEAKALADGGDLGAAQSLIGLSKTVDQLNRAVNTSGADYNDLFYRVQDALDSTNIPDGISNNIVQGNFGGGVSSELQALYDERDARLADQEADHRSELAIQLAQHISAWAEATNRPVFAIADQIGLSMNSLVRDLGVNLDQNLANLTVASVQSLGNISNLLGVELTDLAFNLGEDVGAALGLLSDSQSLLNDALEGTIGVLPDEFANLLQPLLRDVENAADGTAQEQALAALELATSGLPLEYRNELAPFFDTIDPISELQEQINIGYNQLSALEELIRLQGGQIATPTPKPGINPKAPNSIDIVDSSTPIFTPPVIVGPVQPTRPVPIDPRIIEEIVRLRGQLERLNTTSEEISDNTNEISSSNNVIATKPAPADQNRIIKVAAI